MAQSVDVLANDLPAARPTVLVGEDDPDIQDAVTELLTTAGYDVIRAGDGREMASVLDAGLRPSVILLDLMMPGVNGHDFLAWRGARPDLRRIPVVVYSASVFNEVLIRAQTIAAIVVKPSTAEELLSAISRAATGGNTASGAEAVSATSRLRTPGDRLDAHLGGA